jgi:hypothetical protein
MEDFKSIQEIKERLMSEINFYTQIEQVEATFKKVEALPALDRGGVWEALKQAAIRIQLAKFDGLKEKYEIK